MKKIKAIICIFLVGAISYGVIESYNYFTQTNEEKIFLENIEALSNNEFDFVSNFAKKNWWYKGSSVSFEITSDEPFWFPSNWTQISCCSNATDMDSCNFNGEDSNCTKIPRNPRY